MNRGRKKFYTDDQIDEVLERLVEKWKTERYIPRKGELISTYLDEKNKRGNIFYFILRRHNNSLKEFVKFYNIEYIYRISKDRHKIIDEFVRKCKKDDYFPAYNYIRENNKEIYSIITNTYKSLEAFSKEYGILDIYKKSNKHRLINRKYKRKTEIDITSKINSELRTVGNKKVLVGNIKQIKANSYAGSNKKYFSINRYLKENEIEKIPRHLYNFIEKLKDEKEKTGKIDLKKWMEIINKDKKLKACLYYRYKNNVLTKLINHFGI